VSKGKVQTVLGVIDPEQAGVTLMHDHLYLDLTKGFQEPKDPKYLREAHQPLRMEMLGWVRNHPSQSYDNLRLDDEKAMLEEALNFKALGGSTIVDPTPPSSGRNIFYLQRIARVTGLNVVCGTAYYVGTQHPKDMSTKTVKDITDEFVKEVRDGIDGTDAKAGIIGEIGNSWPWLENEKKCTLAAVKASQETGAPVEIHPGRNPDSPLEIVSFLKKEGADLERIYICHVENRVTDAKKLEAIADYGCYLGIDTFGHDFPLAYIDIGDGGRIRIATQLIKDGYVEKILLSGDFGMKMHLKRYGGFGVAHVVENIVPRLRQEGVSNKEIRQILVENPKRLLTFA